MKKQSAQSSGKVIEFKVVTTVKGKKIGFLQLQSGRSTSSVLIPQKLFTSLESTIEQAFESGADASVTGRKEDENSQIVLKADSFEVI